MTTPIWQPGHLYLTGDLVQPVQVQAPSQSALTNAGFESGVITGWTVTQSGGTGTASIATDKKFAGTYAGRWQGATGSGHSGGVEAVWENATDADVVPGQSITAVAMIALDDTSNSQNQGQVRLNWYNASAALISHSDGTLIHGDSSAWKQSVVTGAAPAGAATVRLAVWTTANSHGGVRVDSASWNHIAPPTTAGLIYKAVQTGPGTSASSEPTWPTTLGVQVIDNTVTWEAVNTNRVVWEASPILLTDGTEPDWPTTPGDFVSDGTVKWECVSRRIEDPNCPNTKVVAILSSKVFAADKDIVRFSATANPLDWTSERDAGFLPTGLQQANANDMAVLAPYRGNLAAFNASSFQMWQTDPDPEAMAQLDQMEGIGSTSYKAAQPVGNDLLFLTKLGVRSVSIAAGADNLAAGDVGMPIDPLVQAAMTADPTLVPLATYYPSAGQYWLTFKAPPVLTAISLSGDLADGAIGDAVSYGYTAHGGRTPYTFTLASGALPTGLALNDEGVVSGTMSAGGDFAWVVRVTDVDGLTDTLADTAHVAAPTAFLYVADNTNDRVKCLALDGTLVASIPVTKPYFLTPSPDGSKIYVGPNTGSTITEIDTQTNAVTRTVAPGFLPSHLVADPVRGRLYASLYSAGTVARIDTSTFTVINSKAVTNQPRAMALTPDGATLFISNESGTGNTAYSLDVTSDTTSVATAALAVGFPGSVAISPDGTKIVYVSQVSTKIVVCALPGLSVLNTLTPGFTPVSVSFSPDGTKYYVTSTDASVHVYSATTYAQTKQITGYDSNILGLYVDAPRNVGYSGTFTTNGGTIYRTDLVNDVKLTAINVTGAAFAIAVGIRNA